MWNSNMMTIDKKKFLKTLDVLADALGRSDNQNSEEIKDELREEGVEIDTIMEYLKNAQQSISMAAKRKKKGVIKFN